MKSKLLIKSLQLFIPIILFSINVEAQVRIVEVDPATETVKIHNFGATSVDISAYRFCSQILYRTLNTQTTVQSGSLNLAPNAEVVVTVNDAYLDDTAADLGLYLPTGSFGSPANMVDFMQWGGSFSFPNGREDVAVAKGIWTAGTFVNVAPPYEYIGDGGQNGFQFWNTLLGVQDFKIGSNFNLYPNPTNSILSITFKNEIPNGTLEVYDMLGKKTLSQALDSNQLTSIDISKLNSGLYLIKISYDGKSETKQFLKN